MSLDPRNRSAAFVTAVLALGFALLLGCGGGGGGGGTGGTSGATITSGYDYYGVSSTTPPTLSPGDQVTLTAEATISGVNSPLTPYNFNVQGGSSNGTVTTAGVLTAGAGVTAGTGYTVTATSNVGPVTWNFTGAAAPGQPILIGIVESSNGGTVAGATITAYNAGAGVVGTATSGANGQFTMVVPTTAVTFGVDISGIAGSSSLLYPQFQYGLASYETADLACLAPLPALNTGNHHYGLPNAIILQSAGSGPPPPPPGCFQ